MRMQRKPTFAGRIKDKDKADISYWAFEKSAKERLHEAWRLHCSNHNIDINESIRKDKSFARKRI